MDGLGRGGLSPRIAKGSTTLPVVVGQALDLGPGRLLRLMAVSGAGAAAVIFLADDPSLQLVAPLFALLICVQLYPLLRTGEVDLFEPPTLTGVYAAFGTLATVAAFSAEGTLSLRFLEYLGPEETSSLAARVIGSSVLGLGAYYVGYYHRSWGVRASRAFPDVSRPTWSRTRLHTTAICLLGAFAVTYVVFQGRLGVEVTEATELAAGKAVWREDPTSSWMTRGGQLGFLAGLLYLAHIAGRGKLRSLLLPGAVLAVNAWLVSRMGQRGAYLLPLLAALGIVHYLRRRVPVALFLGFLLLAVALANVQLAWRTSATPVDSEHRLRENIERPVTALAAHEEDRNRFAVLALVFHAFPDKYDHLLGESYAGLIATFVPRWLWPEKAEYFGWRDTMIVPRLVGAPIPSSYIAVLYANWSYPGILLGMLLWGILHRALNEARRRSPADPGVVLLYTTTVVFLNPTLLGISSAVQYVLPAFVCVLFIGGRRRLFPAASRHRRPVVIRAQE